MALHQALRICLILSFINSVFLFTPEFDTNRLCLRKRMGEKAYTFVRFQVDWYQAHVFCIQKKMELVSIKSKEESVQINRLIKSEAPEVPAFWTSGTKLGAKGAFTFSPFIWFSDASPMMYSDWGRNLQGVFQPDNYGGNEDCMILGNQALIQQTWNNGFGNNPFNNMNNPNRLNNPNNGWNNPNMGNGWNAPNGNNGWNHGNENDYDETNVSAASKGFGKKNIANQRGVYKWADEACNNRFAFICEVTCKTQ